jgi:glycosyltransferase involved in cell wall biosynthesis
VPRERIRIIPFGVTVPDPPSAPPSAAEPPRIVFVGRSLARKGGHRLLELYRSQLADVSELVLVTLDEVQPSPGVHVVNDVRPGDGRLEGILATSRVFAFPSEMDLSPNVVLEAMAVGLPVVALRAGAVAEMVVHGVTGLLVEPNDERGLATAIRSLVTDPARAARMGAAGRARVLERFDARVTTAALLDVLEEARGRHASRAGRGPGSPHLDLNLPRERNVS